MFGHISTVPEGAYQNRNLPTGLGSRKNKLSGPEYTLRNTTPMPKQGPNKASLRPIWTSFLDGGRKFHEGTPPQFKLHKRSQSARGPGLQKPLQGLRFGLFQRGLKVSLGTVSWYGSSCATSFDVSDIAGPALAHKVPILIVTACLR